MSFSGNDDFMNYMGYRHMVTEDKIDEGLRQAERGADTVRIDHGDLTDDEADYVESEIRRRLGR